MRGLLASGALFSAVGRADARGSTPHHTPVNVRLGTSGNVCDAATVAAPRSSAFRLHGLTVTLVPFVTDEALIAALHSGSVDAASVHLPALLKPLEHGADVRVAAGLHAGCLRVLVGDAAELTWIGDVQGTTIATDQLHGSSMKLLWAILRRQGLDPKSAVAWRVYDQSTLESALDRQTVTCVATSDPLGYDLLLAQKARTYPVNPTGGFFCGSSTSAGHHCFLALCGALVDRRPHIAEAITRAYLDLSEALGRACQAAELSTVYGPFVADLDATLAMLSSYTWNPSAQYVFQEVEVTARDFRRAGLLNATTDPEDLAERACADIIRA